MSNQRGEHAESRSLVNHPIKAVVSEAMHTLRFVAMARHLLPGNRITSGAEEIGTRQIHPC